MRNSSFNINSFNNNNSKSNNILINSSTRNNFESNNESIYADSSSDSDDELNSSMWKSQPEVWHDDTRMNALFAPFRNRDMNPLHYDNKLKFWKEAILSYCNEKNIIQFDLGYLESCFMRKNIKPKCLDLVIGEMVREKMIQTRDEALKPKPGLVKNVFNKLVWSPLSWSTSYLMKPLSYVYATPDKSVTHKSYSFTSNLDTTVSPISSPGRKDERSEIYVIGELLESKSSELLKQLQSHVVYSNVDTVVEYEQIFRNTSFNEKDVDLLLKYLQVNNKVLITTVNNRKLVKFSTNDKPVEPINEIEIGYWNLKDSEIKLENETNKIHQQIENVNLEIKNHLKQNQKNQALKLLKKKKQLEKSLESKDNVLSNLQSMIMSIHQADTNKITYDAYNKSLGALKQANKDLNIDKIDETIGDIQDTLESNKEIEDALCRSPIGKHDYDDEELNQELDELLASDSLKKNLFEEGKDKTFDMQDLLNTLPKVPLGSPTQTTKNTSKVVFTS